MLTFSNVRVNSSMTAKRPKSAAMKFCFSTILLHWPPLYEEELSSINIDLISKMLRTVCHRTLF